MELKKKSFSTELYKWFYGVKDIETLTDGCEFLWKISLAYILFIPMGMLSLPMELISVFMKNEIGETNILERIGNTIILFFVLLLLVGFGFLISTIWVDYKEQSLGSSMCIVGGVFVGVVLMIVTIVGWDMLKDYINNQLSDDYDEQGNKIYKTPSNPILALYKAKKEKSCPKITWKD